MAHLPAELERGYFITLQRLVDNAQSSLTSILWMVAAAAQDILNTNDFYNFLNLEEEQLGKKIISQKNLAQDRV